MQNRRLFRDDAKGVEEILNERDEFNNPIVTEATYYL